MCRHDGCTILTKFLDVPAAAPAVALVARKSFRRPLTEARTARWRGGDTSAAGTGRLALKGRSPSKATGEEERELRTRSGGGRVALVRAPS